MDEAEKTTEKKIEAKGKRLADALIKTTKEKLGKSQKVKIKVPIDNLNPNNLIIPVCINGVVFKVERGVEVEVPVQVKKMLERAGLY